MNFGLKSRPALSGGIFIERIEKEIARNRGVLAAEELKEYELALAIYQKLAKRARD